MTSPETTTKPPLTDAQRVERGRAVDELQDRIAGIKRQGAAVPDEWQHRLRELAEAHDYDTVCEHVEWMNAALPPQRYATEEITWQTFAHFSTALLNDLTLYVMRSELINKDPRRRADATQIMLTIDAIEGATDSPVIAMNEFEKCRKRALQLEGFAESS